MTDQIEMLWKCAACGTVNGGLSKRCGERVLKSGKIVLAAPGIGCGKAQDREPWFDPPDNSSAARLIDAQQIKQAGAGADWRCFCCDSTQRRDDGACANCGAGQSEYSKGDAEPLPSASADCHESGSSVRSASETWASQRGIASSFKPNRHSAKLAAIGGTVLLVALLAWWLLSPRYVNATVTGRFWQSTVSVERFKRVHDEGWHVPFGAEDMRIEGNRVHHYDHVAIGSHQQPYSDSYSCGQTCSTVSVPRSCTSNRNGTQSCTGGGTRQSCSTKYCTRTLYRTVTDYQDQPRYAMWFSWMEWRWVHARNVASSGDNASPVPPTSDRIALGVGCFGREQERISGTSYRFRCDLVDEERRPRSFDPRDEVGLKACTAGRVAKLRIQAGITSLEQWE